MQGLNDSPRDGIAVETIEGLLQSYRNVAVAYGARRLNNALNVQDDLTEFMSGGGSIQSDSGATIHRTCTLNLDAASPLVLGVDLVQPYVTLSNPDTDESATFNLGVYTLASPTYDNSKVPSVLQVTGYDLLYYIDTEIGDTVQVAAGTNPITAALAYIIAAFPDAVTISTPTTSVLSSPMTFIFDSSNSSTTYLSVVNALLAAAGYRGLWVDWDGVFRLEPYAAPGTRDAEWIFDLGSDTNVVAESRTSDMDLFDVPNTWLFVMTDLQVAPVEGISQFTYIDDSPRNPGSVASRGRTVRSTTFIQAADYNALVALGMRTVSADLTPAEHFTVSTSPFPLAWHYDRIDYRDPNLALVPPVYESARQVQALSWDLPLDGQSDMTWTWQTVLT